MQNINKYDKYEYLYKMIPDIQFVSYYEKIFWNDNNKIEYLNKNNYYNDVMYNIIKLSNGTTSKIYDTLSYRALVISDYELSFVPVHDQFIIEIEPFSGRHVYAVFSSDSDAYRESVKFKLNKILEENNEYVFILRF